MVTLDDIVKIVPGIAGGRAGWGAPYVVFADGTVVFSDGLWSDGAEKGKERRLYSGFPNKEALPTDYPKSWKDIVLPKK